MITDPYIILSLLNRPDYGHKCVMNMNISEIHKVNISQQLRKMPLRYQIFYWRYDRYKSSFLIGLAWDIELGERIV